MRSMSSGPSSARRGRRLEQPEQVPALHTHPLAITEFPNFSADAETSCGESMAFVQEFSQTTKLNLDGFQPCDDSSQRRSINSHWCLAVGWPFLCCLFDSSGGENSGAVESREPAITRLHREAAPGEPVASPRLGGPLHCLKKLITLVLSRWKAA